MGQQETVLAGDGQSTLGYDHIKITSTATSRGQIRCAAASPPLHPGDDAALVAATTASAAAATTSASLTPNFTTPRSNVALVGGARSSAEGVHVTVATPPFCWHAADAFSA